MRGGVKNVKIYEKLQTDAIYSAKLSYFCHACPLKVVDDYYKV